MSDQLVAETPSWQHTTLTTNIHAPVGIRTHNPSRWAAADLRLRPRGHWDRHVIILFCIIYYVILCLYYLSGLIKVEGSINTTSTWHGTPMRLNIYNRSITPERLNWNISLGVIVYRQCRKLYSSNPRQLTCLQRTIPDAASIQFSLLMMSM